MVTLESKSILRKETRIRRQHPSRWRRRQLKLFWIPLLSLLGLYWFAASFFLAKKSLTQRSTCEEAPALLRNHLGLIEAEIQASLSHITSGCWSNRRVDSLVILVVDALRFDFAQYHLPQSIGSRISSTPHGNVTTSSQLLQFVADPPTVTMQRLKGLTTGGLPTFADISGNFGGAAIDEDTWIDQLLLSERPSAQFPAKLGFVGDDTWVDLFPTQFSQSFPFPSFNTRDLDTVDNGCLEKLPQLLKNLRMDGSSPDELEVVISHFLGVDHVGHTYGPNNKHMDAKLRQMDDALSTTLEVLDTSDHCHLALIFGDHGMTEDGNHGGGTEEEVNAALFAHFSKQCGTDAVNFDMTTNSMGSTFIQNAFQSIHQIDLVPTISALLGIPIPYANLGGLVPSLVGTDKLPEIASTLALNAAQVWRYFTVYSETANRLPNLDELQEQLNEAVHAYKEALLHPEAHDSSAFYKACGLFKVFLVQASELGHRVWTRFDTTGMFLGGGIFLICLALSILFFFLEECPPFLRLHPSEYLENGVCAVLMIFQCGMLSFSNSYIDAEQAIILFIMGVLGVIVHIRLRTVAHLQSDSPRLTSQQQLHTYPPLLLPGFSRFHETLISGHGTDPSIELHLAHMPLAFLSSLALLLLLRFKMPLQWPNSTRFSIFHLASDMVCLLFLGISWLEKRNSDPSLTGFLWARAATALIVITTPLSIIEQTRAGTPGEKDGQDDKESTGRNITRSMEPIVKLLLILMAVTGPSTASSVVVLVCQAFLLHHLGASTGRNNHVSAALQACFWRMTLRHMFFATNHACAFNRLQYSAAFVSTSAFSFALGGSQLFLNTFGWEILGLVLVRLSSTLHKSDALWRWYSLYQMIETFCSCISVSLLRRHLMVWAVYAPRFLFAAIFWVLHGTFQVLVYLKE